jgi:hypothetical protein
LEEPKMAQECSRVLDERLKASGVFQASTDIFDDMLARAMTQTLEKSEDVELKVLGLLE